MLNDPLAATLAKISNAERVGKKEVIVKPSSKIIKKVISILNDNNYLGSFEETSDSNGSYNFSYVLSGSNSISVKPHAYPLDNYGLTNSGDGHTVSLNSSQSHINMDLGQIPAPVGDYCSF